MIHKVQIFVYLVIECKQWCLIFYPRIVLSLDQEKENNGYDEYFASDGTSGNFFGPAFDDFFTKVESGIDDEIGKISI